MNFTLDAKQQTQLSATVNSNSIRKFLLLKESMNFEVGDVIVKYTKRGYGTDEKWVPTPISSTNAMPQRFVIVHKDEFGISYFKKLKVSNGTLGVETYALNDFEYAYTRFDVDPEYAETQLLEADFSIKELHKKSLEHRKIIIKMNRKIGTKPKNLNDYNEFFKGMKAGDKFWATSDYAGRYINECTLTQDPTLVPTSTLDQNRDWEWRRMKERHKDKLSAYFNVTDVVKLFWSAKTSYNTQVHDGYAYAAFGRDGVLFKSQPAVEDKKT